MPNHYGRSLRIWRSKTKPDDSLVFIKNWEDSLHKELVRHGADKEFVMDMLQAASVYFTETFSDDEKADVFVYTLGLLSPKR